MLRTNLLILTLISLLFAACSDNGVDSGTEPDIETYTVTDLPANPDFVSGEAEKFTLFSLINNEIVSPADSVSNKWDIGFAGTTIIINNTVSGPGGAGAVMLDMPFEDVKTAPTQGYKTDTEEAQAISGWYNYTGMGEPMHAILPIENKTIVLKTADGKQYAKLRILNYYKGNPDFSSSEFTNLSTRSASRYYTFEYVITTDGDTNLTN